MKHHDMTDEMRAKKLAEARAKHGKGFINDTPKERETEPSYILREINRRSAEIAKQTNILTIRKVTK